MLTLWPIQLIALVLPPRAYWLYVPLGQSNAVTVIYTLALANSGVIQFLRDHPRANYLVVVHELTDVSRKALENGTYDAIISQDTGHLVRSAVRLVKAVPRGKLIDYDQECRRIGNYLNENLPVV